MSAIALIFTLAYSTSCNLLAAFKQTLAIFFSVDNLGLQAIYRFGRFLLIRSTLSDQ